MRRRTARAARESRLASGWVVEGESAPVDEPAPAPDPTDVPDATADASGSTATGQASSGQLSSAALILLGVMGGLYLIYTWVWFSWANYYSAVNSVVAEGFGSVGSVLQQVTFWAAPFAPALWFFSVLWVHRGAPTVRVAIWLLVGAVVLFPLPMLDFGSTA